jgi:DNA-directed RNA polymerase subunit RPC12/RpoP
MDENALIGVKCPNCGHVGPETLGHLKAHWEERFRCERCGIDMSMDREELPDAINVSDLSASFIITMHKAQ